MSNKSLPLILCVSCWTSLGFYRGLNQYDHLNMKYKNSSNPNPNKYPYLYSSKIINGFMGSFIYLNPMFLFLTIPKEIYRLEVDLRGLEFEKKQDRYNDLM